MGILDKIKGKLSKQPSLKVDKTMGDKRLARFQRLLAKGEWEPVQEYFSKPRNQDKRAFYAGVLTDVRGRPEWLDEWVETYDDDATGWLLRGSHGIVWAWEARGAGSGESVSDGAWEIFHERLAEAEEDLYRASELDPRDPIPWAKMVVTSFTLQREREEVEACYQKAIERHPECVEAATKMLMYLCEKWHGSHDEMFDFARDLHASSRPGSRMHLLLAQAHIERWLYHHAFEEDTNAANEYFVNPEVRDELFECAAQSIDHPSFPSNPATVEDRNTFAFCYWQMEDAERLERELRIMGDGISDYPWQLHHSNIAVPVTNAREWVGLA